MIFLFILIFLNFFALPSLAYKLFIISFPDNYGKTKKEKVFYVGAAEPAFGTIYDLKPPKKFFLLPPDKKPVKITLFRTKYEDKALNLERIGYKIQLSLEVKGDHYICIESDYYLTRDLKLIKSFAKVPFHVEIEKGWDNFCGFDLEIKPYTRPYGFSDKGIFWGQVLYNYKPLSNVIVEFERFSPVFLNLEDLPKDSYGEINYPYLKKTVKTNKDGFFVVSLEKPGWWVLTIKRGAGTKTFGNTSYPVEIASHFWIYVLSSKEENLKYNFLEKAP
jgi:cobalt/nickel transport protein